MYEKILVPLDGSKLAEQAFPYVAELAKAFVSEVTIIGVCEPEEKESGQACRLYVGNEAEILKNTVGDSAQFKTVVLEGKAAEQILNYARENAISLIIMTSHGRSGIMPWSLGSTVNRVLQRVGVPLLVVRAKEHPTATPKGLFNRILVPLDDSESSLEVLPHVAEVAKKLQSEVILLHVVETGRHVHTIGGLNFVPYKDQDMNTLKAKAKEYLEKARTKLAGVKTVRNEIKVGEGARDIIKFAKEADCSLIAMTSHGHSGIEAWSHGSVTYKILQGSDKSVLLVPCVCW